MTAQRGQTESEKNVFPGAFLKTSPKESYNLKTRRIHSGPGSTSRGRGREGRGRETKEGKHTHSDRRRGIERQDVNLSERKAGGPAENL